MVTTRTVPCPATPTPDSWHIILLVTGNLTLTLTLNTFRNPDILYYTNPNSDVTLSAFDDILYYTILYYTNPNSDVTLTAFDDIYFQHEI